MLYVCVCVCVCVPACLLQLRSIYGKFKKESELLQLVYTDTSFPQLQRLAHKQGTIAKQAGNNVKKWDMKQIVVIDSFLVWFDTQSDKKPKGIVRMDEARSEVCDLSVIGKQFGMKVTTTKTQREYFFSATSDLERSAWLDSFEKVRHTFSFQSDLPRFLFGASRTHAHNPLHSALVCTTVSATARTSCLCCRVSSCLCCRVSSCIGQLTSPIASFLCLWGSRRQKRRSKAEPRLQIALPLTSSCAYLGVRGRCLPLTVVFGLSFWTQFYCGPHQAHCHLLNRLNNRSKCKCRAQLSVCRNEAACTSFRVGHRSRTCGW